MLLQLIFWWNWEVKNFEISFKGIKIARRNFKFFNNFTGQPNPCLTSVIQRLLENSNRFGEQYNGCTTRANTITTGAIEEVFYPTFQDIQVSTSTVPLLTLDALSRGNLFDDQQEILDYLDSQYEVIILQWLGAVSQLFRWETNRFRIEGEFYIEEMTVCGGDYLYAYQNMNTFLMYEAYDTCRP